MIINYNSLDYISSQLNDLKINNEKIRVKVGMFSTIYKFNLLSIYSKRELEKKLDILSNFIKQKIEILDNKEIGVLEIALRNIERFYPNFMENGEVLKNREDGSMLLGYSMYDKPLVFNIQETKSILIAGSTGGGKSVAMNNLILSLLLYSENVKLNLIDLKKVELSIYKDLEKVENYADDFISAIKILKSVIEEIKIRYSIMEEKGIRKSTTNDFPINITFIDEYAELSSVNQKLVDSLVSRIAQIGRACNVYLVIATQTPTNKVISNMIRSNLPSRIGLRTTNVAQSVAIIQTKDCVNLLGKGDSYLQIDGVSDLIHCQICSITEKEIFERIIKNKETKTTQERKGIKEKIKKWLNLLMKK